MTVVKVTGQLIILLHMTCLLGFVSDPGGE
jgi:hypothetical protein